VDPMCSRFSKQPEQKKTCKVQNNIKEDANSHPYYECGVMPAPKEIKNITQVRRNPIIENLVQKKT
jgi:hypothetical protein